MKKISILVISAVVMVLSCTKEEEVPVITTPDPQVDSCFIVLPYTDQLPNFNLEEWGNPENSGGRYEEPCGGIWASGNGGSVLAGGYLVLAKESIDVHEGAYAAKLVTHQTSLGILAAGSLFTGKFILNWSKPFESARLGIPFSKKPKSLDGYYKYTSVNSDSAQVLVLLTKYNSVAKKTDTVGFGTFTEYNTVTSYTAYSTIIDYNYSAGNDIPDTLVVSFTSSAGSATEDLLGEVGSTLYVDDAKFVY